jgi:hypothetical protein
MKLRELRKIVRRLVNEAVYLSGERLNLVKQLELTNTPVATKANLLMLRALKGELSDVEANEYLEDLRKMMVNVYKGEERIAGAHLFKKIKQFVLDDAAKTRIGGYITGSLKAIG